MMFITSRRLHVPTSRSETRNSQCPVRENPSETLAYGLRGLEVSDALHWDAQEITRVFPFGKIRNLLHIYEETVAVERDISVPRLSVGWVRREVLPQAGCKLIQSGVHAFLQRLHHRAHCLLWDRLVTGKAFVPHDTARPHIKQFQLQREARLDSRGVVHFVQRAQISAQNVIAARRARE